MKRVIFKVLLYSVAFYLFLLALRGVSFLVAHLPSASALDKVLVAIVSVEGILTAPKRFLRMVWPSQATPGFLNMALTILNSLIWGAALAFVPGLLRKGTSISKRQ